MSERGDVSILDLPPEELDTGDATLAFGRQEQSAGFVLRIAQLAAFERFFAIFPVRTIKISEFSVLYGIAENPGVRQGALADVLRIKWSNMTKLVRTLEDRGLVLREVPKADRRAVQLFITDQGRALIDSVSAEMEACDRQAFHMLDEAEHAQLLTLLRKVAGWPPEQAPEAP